MTSPSFPSELRNEVLRRIKPESAERERLREVASSLISRIKSLARSEGFNCIPILVGSAARGTWLSGDHDLDIFLAVPPNEDLDRAFELARQVAPEHDEKYAEHAYVHACMNGFEVDLVPCYQVASASSLKSAVDRTPFHSNYVASRIAGLEDDVLILKQFMKATGVYGSELKVRGFSGYLTELLVLYYGSFLSVLEVAATWKPGEIIDLEGHSGRHHEEPLIVVDPVDPARNVAAALSLDKLMQFAAASRCFLKGPTWSFFFPTKQEPLSDQKLFDCFEKRASRFLLIEFSAPRVVEDVLFPQLRKAEESIKALLHRQEFSVLRSDAGCDGDKAFILLELDVWELPRVRRRVGPPVWEDIHLSRFISFHPSPLSGPYIEDGHAVVEITRKHTTARDLLHSELASLSLGKHLNKEISKGYNIYVGPELAQNKDKGFRVFLANYLEAKVMIC
jgi:tRNA nucleotidyltransferase (CCA-adding enzyme)